LGQSADGLSWSGSHKMDPWTTLSRAEILDARQSLTVARPATP